ncbi:MAG: nucleotide exchange factor GrpE [Deltaproteobacteria bacterium]|nr:nucleotide exchange factor GrpE [Deltaproteobacteria bacterium]
MSKKEKIEKYKAAEKTVVDDDANQEKEPKVKENEEDTGPLESLQNELDAAKTEASQNYDRLLRVSAEFENYKKRAVRDSQELRKYANEEFVKLMLPVVDNLERAIESADDSAGSNASLLEGVKLTLTELLKMFDRFYIKAIDAIDQPFDPMFHQAIMQEGSDEKPENTVIREMQKGYLMHDRLIRPSMVVVSTGKLETETSKPDTETKKDNSLR